MNDETNRDETTENKTAESRMADALVPVEPVHDVAMSVARIDAALTLAEKSRLLWEMPTDARHQTLGALPAPVVAALIEGDPEQNTALIANLPAAKYRQVINLDSGTFD